MAIICSSVAMEAEYRLLVDKLNSLHGDGNCEGEAEERGEPAHRSQPGTGAAQHSVQTWQTGTRLSGYIVAADTSNRLGHTAFLS